jgi:predicted SprT family Zn-dependent metalloprotease
MITASLKPAEVTEVLHNHGFTGLVLKKVEDKKYTYTFDSVDVRSLKQRLQAPSVAQDGKVLVFDIPGVGRLGVAVATHMLRLVDESKVEKTKTSKHHVQGIGNKVPEVLAKAYPFAQATQSKRVPFMKKLFQWANKEYFGNRLDEPSITTTLTPFSPKLKTARGVYRGGTNFSAGHLWMWGKTFNADLDFFAETFVHEMCHAAAHQISQSRDRDEGGHGPVWQGWMRKCGLNPSRYDTTEEAEYESAKDAALKESELTRKFGPRVLPEEVGLTKYPGKPRPGVPVVVAYQGRLFKGKFVGKNFAGESYLKGGKSITLTYKGLPEVWI